LFVKVQMVFPYNISSLTFITGYCWCMHKLCPRDRD
jgi:hypothetical protein